MTTLEELLRTRVARSVAGQPDWAAFADARVEGYRRAQHRYIGAGASGKTDARAIPAEQFTLSVMFVPPGQGNAAHTHEVEEVFFILDGKVKVFFEDGADRREETVLGRWDCVSAPAGVIHGFENVGLEPAYLQVMLGRARPGRDTGADRHPHALGLHLAAESTRRVEDQAGRDPGGRRQLRLLGRSRAARPRGDASRVSGGERAIASVWRVELYRLRPELSPDVGQRDHAGWTQHAQAHDRGDGESAAHQRRAGRDGSSPRRGPGGRRVGALLRALHRARMLRRLGRDPGARAGAQAARCRVLV